MKTKIKDGSLSIEIDLEELIEKVALTDDLAYALEQNEDFIFKLNPKIALNVFGYSVIDCFRPTKAQFTEFIIDYFNANSTPKDDFKKEISEVISTYVDYVSERNDDIEEEEYKIKGWE